MLLLHTGCSLMSEIAFLVAFIFGILFLLQERQLKRKTLGRLFHRLPPLNALEQINFAAISFGFALLSIGLACGFIGEHVLLGRWWTGDPKEYLTVGLWMLYFGVWWLRRRATLRGRRVALLSVAGFSFALVTLLGASWLLPSWHRYF